MPELLPLDLAALSKLHEISPTSSLGAHLSEQTIANFAKTQPPQTSHRLDIIEAWGGKPVFEGKSVLELGCGQGDATVVLAAAVSDADGKGRVLGWDPAPGDYGSPLTVAQAQANILDKPELQDGRLAFSLTTPLSAVLALGSSRYDIATLLHSIYYFPSPAVVLSTLKALHDHQPPIATLCIAEHGLRASHIEQNAHVMAVLSQSARESLVVDRSEQNVQTVLSPEQITELAVQAGWRKRREHFVTPAPGLQDGKWEVGTVVSELWEQEGLKMVQEAEGIPDGIKAKQSAWIVAARQATIQAVDLVWQREKDKPEDTKSKLGLVRTMDAWCAVFERAD